MEHLRIPVQRWSSGDQSWIKDYRDQGYTIFEQLLPMDLIDSHLGSYEKLLTEYNLNGRDAMMRMQAEIRREFEEAIEKLYCDPSLSLRLCRYSAMHNVTTQLFAKESVSWMPLTVIWGGGAVPHRDIIFFRDPPVEAARFWIALEDLHPDSGLLYVIPASHKNAYRYDELLQDHPEFLEILRSLSFGDIDSGNWGRLMKPILDHHHAESARVAESFPKDVLYLKKGDALLFDPAVVHGSLVPANPNLTRKSFIMECRSRHCRTYSMRAYFGSRHDFRRPANASAEKIIESPLGPYGRSALKEKIAKLPPIVGFA